METVLFCFVGRVLIRILQFRYIKMFMLCVPNELYLFSLLLYNYVAIILVFRKQKAFILLISLS